MDSSGTTTMVNLKGLYQGSVTMPLSKPIQYQMIMDTFDSNYAVWIKKLIFPGYNNNKFIDGKMVMLLMVIKELTSTETCVLYGPYKIYRPGLFQPQMRKLI